MRIPLPLARPRRSTRSPSAASTTSPAWPSAFALDVDDGVVRRARIGLGGVAAAPLRARATEEALDRAAVDRETVDAAASVLAAEGTPIDDHRASAAYRAAMLGQALLRLLRADADAGRRSAHEPPVRPARRRGRRHGPCRTRAPPCTSPGSALYTDDLVGRTRTSCTPGRCRPRTPTRASPACDRSRRYACPGVVRVLTADDVPGVNDAGVKHDEPLFPTEVMFHGHAVCWVLGETLEAARLGADAVEVDYEPLPALVTVREAIAAEQLPGRPAAPRAG